MLQCDMCRAGGWRVRRVRQGLSNRARSQDLLRGPGLECSTGKG